TGGDNYILANGTEPQNPLVPANTNETGGGKIIDSIFSGLVGYDADGETYNEVAESIEANDDNTEFTITLKDWKFTDGTDVTSESFVKACDAAVANAQRGAYSISPNKG